MSLPITQTDDVSQRITKLLPADLTAAFIAIFGAVPAAGISGDWIVYGAIAIAVLAPFYFYFVLETRNAFHIAFLLCTFLVFVVTLDPTNIGNVLPSLRPALGGISVIISPIWVFLVTPIAAKVLKAQLEG